VSATKGESTAKLASVKEKALEEFKLFWIIALYLWLLFGAFMAYRRLVLAEFGVTYLNIGFAVVQALIIGKVILIGDAFKLGRRFEDGPLVYSVLWKALIFSLFVMTFGVLEHVVEGLFHKESARDIALRIVGIGKDELAARTLMLIAAFVPFFAFWELGRVVGREKLAALFFSRRKAAREAERSASTP
jgi:hypothetical protein